MALMTCLKRARVNKITAYDRFHFAEVSPVIYAIVILAAKAILVPSSFAKGSQYALKSY
jgi:hypothetical protein